MFARRAGCVVFSEAIAEERQGMRWTLKMAGWEPDGADALLMAGLTPEDVEKAVLLPAGAEGALDKTHGLTRLAGY